MLAENAEPCQDRKNGNDLSHAAGRHVDVPKGLAGVDSQMEQDPQVDQARGRPGV